MRAVSRHVFRTAASYGWSWALRWIAWVIGMRRCPPCKMRCGVRRVTRGRTTPWPICTRTRAGWRTPSPRTAAHYRLSPISPRPIPTSAMPFVNWADSEDAATSLRQALEIRPDMALAHNLLGLTLRDQGKLAEAIASLQAAIGLGADFAEAHFNLGLVFQDLADRPNALRCFHQALACRPDYVDASLRSGHRVEGRRRTCRGNPILAGCPAHRCPARACPQRTGAGLRGHRAIPRGRGNLRAGARPRPQPGRDA